MSLIFLYRSLYPGLEGRFVLESIAPHVMTSLKEAAKSRGRHLLIMPLSYSNRGYILSICSQLTTS